MAFKKLLLPIACTLSTAATIAPIVTSCGGAYVINGKTIYKPKSALAIYDWQTYGVDGMDDDQATTLYCEDLKANPDVYKEDILYAESINMYKDLHSQEAKTNKDKVNLKFDFQDISSNSENKTLSFKLTGSIYIKRAFDTTAHLMKFNSFTIDAHDLAFNCHGSKNNWSLALSVGPTSKAFIKVDGFAAIGSRFYNYHNEEFGFSNYEEYGQLSLSQDWFLTFLRFNYLSPSISYHMQNILSKN